jgi:epoxyqueuosine reductase
MKAEEVCRLALEAGFSTAAAAPLSSEDAAVFGGSAQSVLLCALAYGNAPPPDLSRPANVSRPTDTLCEIAPFARRNYYKEAAVRLKAIARKLREGAGGGFCRSDFRVFCNSRYDEKKLAAAYGLGALGRNGLVLTEAAGCQVVIAGLTLPFGLECAAAPLPDFYFCRGCGTDGAPCVRACPTGALDGSGRLVREKCIQWYASGHGAEVPPEVLRVWGRRLYGCILCQEACVHSRRPLCATGTAYGPLPRFVNAAAVLSKTDDELRTMFKGTALGLSWLGPAALRRNARCCLAQQSASVRIVELVK